MINPLLNVLWLLGGYLVLGIVVNMIELICGVIFQREEFKEFIRDMASFEWADQFICVVIYIAAWPFLLYMNIHDLVRSADEKLNGRNKDTRDKQSS